MQTLRDIEDVHKKIIAIIPDENKDLKNELNEFIDSIWNLAPELRKSGYTFLPYQNILLKHLDHDNLNNVWKPQIKHIFNGTDE
jgi:hypothetical protein